MVMRIKMYCPVCDMNVRHKVIKLVKDARWDPRGAVHVEYEEFEGCQRCGVVMMPVRRIRK